MRSACIDLPMDERRTRVLSAAPLRALLGFFCVASACLPGRAGQTDAATETFEPYPLEYFARRPVIGNARVSPDGKYLSWTKIPSKGGDPVIEVYDTGDLGKRPFRMDADPMEITGYRWVSDTDIVFELRQQVRTDIEDFNRGIYEYKIGLVNVETRKMKAFGDTGIYLEHVLPHKPDKIIVSFLEGRDAGPAARVVEAFRPRSYHELDLKRGTKKLLIRGKWAVGSIGFDGEGEPWIARGYDWAKHEYIWYWRPEGTSGWEEFRRESYDSFELQPFAVFGLDPEKPGHALVVARNGHDTQALWSYDLVNKEFAEAIYRRADVDVAGTVSHSNWWKHPDTPAGLWYVTDKTHIEYFDLAEEALRNQLLELIPNAYEIDIISRSRDGQTMVVHDWGSRNPGTYYLVKDGRLQKIGARQPLLGYAGLADVEFVSYRARDGMRIPAYVTIPHGEPPFPLVVMPHGGPFSRDWGRFDEWAQVLANNGYLVIQPQFRGSTGFGLELQQAAFAGGSQMGRKMQDDKDDAAKYLVERGLADPDRMAMYGWSYGGYAALVAAARTPQMYQCVIAGAAVSDPMMQINYYRWELGGEVRDRHVTFDELGVQPVHEAEKVNVPMLIVHGDVDQRVPVEHAKKYMKRLDEHDKDYKYVELKGADHFTNTLFYDHKIKFYESMIAYLANDCGPGGL